MSRESGDGLPTGEQPDVPNDVSDPHPSTEQNQDKIPAPGGVKGVKGPDIGPNSYVHAGKAQPRPKNKGAGPK